MIISSQAELCKLSIWLVASVKLYENDQWSNIDSAIRRPENQLHSHYLTKWWVFLGHLIAVLVVLAVFACWLACLLPRQRKVIIYIDL